MDLNELDRRLEEEGPVAKAEASKEPPRILELEEVMDLTGLSEAKIYRLERDGWFPPSRTFSRRAVWVKGEVDEWVVLWQRRVAIPTRIRVRVKKPPPEPSMTRGLSRVVRSPLLGAPRRVRRASRRS